MIFFHFVYLFFYIICKKLASKYIYDVPEDYAIGFTMFLYTLTIEVAIHELLRDQGFYNSIFKVVSFIGLLVFTSVLQSRYYVKTERYLSLFEKYKYWPLLMAPVLCVWIYFLYNYFAFKYHNF